MSSEAAKKTPFEQMLSGEDFNIGGYAVATGNPADQGSKYTQAKLD